MIVRTWVSLYRGRGGGKDTCADRLQTQAADGRGRARTARTENMFSPPTAAAAAAALGLFACRSLKDSGGV